MTLPAIVRETGDWALLLKPHGMMTAPLVENEKGTLLAWFFEECPAAGLVAGKKAIEHGLVHRLDNGTEGLVLIAKTQSSYDNLYSSQQNGLIRKTYFAFCILPSGNVNGFEEKLPFSLKSRFRAFGKGRRKVKPVFPGARFYADAKTDYETVIEKIEPFEDDKSVGITCSLIRGFRHQVRSHLAYLGFPIFGDPLYNPDCAKVSDSLLQLYAQGISFPDPVSKERVIFLLPRPDKMSR